MADMLRGKPPSLDWIRDMGRFDARTHEKMLALQRNRDVIGARLPIKFRHLMWIGVDLLVTHLFPYGVEMHMHRALDHGATVEEIVEVLEIASTVADCSFNVAIPLILEVAAEEGAALPDRSRPLSAEENELKTALAEKLGFLPNWFDLLIRTDPEFVRAYLDLGHAPFKQGALDPKSRAMIYLALYSSPALIEEQEIRRHAREALRRGASVEELLTVIEFAGGISNHVFVTGIPALVATLPEYGS